jgi:Holliday junction resolvase
MSSYRKGYLAEKACREVFESWFGCTCIESRGSHGTVDLICANGMQTYVVQVKDTDEQPHIDWKELCSVAEMFQAIPVLAWKQRGGRWKLITDMDDLEQAK